MKQEILLEERSHNDLMSEKYKKIRKYLDYVEHLLILVSTVTVGITSPAVEIKICEPLQQLKSISQLQRKRRILYYIKTMETYCVSCKKNTKNENSTVRKTKQNKLMILSNCSICGKKKLIFIEKSRNPQF